MFKKIVSAAAALAIMTMLAGCGCTTVTPAATPTPTATTAPTPEIVSPMPESTDNAMETPGAETTPGGAAENPGAGKTIENFQEGTEVQAADVPEIEQAVKTKYPDATIERIQHATNNGAQVYAVEIKSGGTAQTVYVSPDGTVQDNNG